MILIASEKNDFSTNEVIDYLMAENVDFLRINREDRYEFKFKKEGIFIKINQKEILLNNIDTFWYRRGKLQIYRSLKFTNIFHSYFSNEVEVLNHHLNQGIGVRKLNNYYSSDPNKLEVIEFAKELDILTPKTYVIDNKDDVISLYSDHAIVTKGITGSSVFENIATGEIHLSYTTEINKKNINKLPESFFPSLFQEKIEKAYEIRTFFLERRFWSMAIFSQENQKTKIDFRHYDKSKPNRKASYLLPKHLEAKLNLLMEKIGLNSGSIDFIVSKSKKQIYFLEVNPIGQFAMTSSPCNYNLEQHISKYLINETT